MGEKFDPAHADRLENPERLVELPPAHIVELLGLRGDETVVDFGAGTGLYALPVAEALPQGRLLAVDEQPALLERLRAKLPGHPAGARVVPVLAEGGRVPLPDGVADRVFLVNVLHHIDDDPVAQSELARLLRPGGLLLALEYAQMERPVGPPNDHVLPLTGIRSLLAGLGLEEQAVYGPGVVGRYHNAVLARRPAP